ncbi:MAG TPA: hypothetical protein VGG72_27835 [Bryobacteraceae bacterium]|jgi:hypothetical protein
MTAASEYVLEPHRNGAEFTLYRARQHGNPSPLLVVARTAEQPLPTSLRPLEHEYSLTAKLEPAWVATPLAPRITKDGQSLFSPAARLAMPRTTLESRITALKINKNLFRGEIA